jgi:hypothetical protein
MTAAPAVPVPAVSVLIAVHNGLPYVESALRSVMNQTFREIEIVVVDDCSTDATPALLDRLAAEDARIRLLRLATNHRLPGALNRGLELVRAPLVARMDADDLCHPTRLDVQKRFMEARPGVALISSSVRRIDAQGRRLSATPRPRDPAMCRWMMRFRLPLVHPAFMFRWPMPDGARPRYDPAFDLAEDHEFAIRVLDHGDLVSLPDILLDYRVHAANTTSRNWVRQTGVARAAAEPFIARELPPAVAAGLAPFMAAFFGLERQDPAAVFAGLRAMLAHDTARWPGRAAWLRRQTAQLAWDALQRSRMPKRARLAAFLGPGRDFLPHLMLRGAEIGGLLPRAWRSDPDVWGPDVWAAAGGAASGTGGLV